ncbi:MAG TPA: hypothetical protein VFI05_05395 [Nitrospiraceae bacterium]|nr:hypothetical protein [Nitrospiraceae bacterium]
MNEWMVQGLSLSLVIAAVKMTCAARVNVEKVDGIFAGVRDVCAVSSHDPTGTTILTFHLVF